MTQSPTPAEIEALIELARCYDGEDHAGGVVFMGELADALTALQSRIAELEEQATAAVEGAQPLWSGEVRALTDRALAAEANLAAMTAKRDAQKADAMKWFSEALDQRTKAARLEAALIRLRDCDWTISRGDRMDAVRDIARAALSEVGT